jgi:hypothetical protein
MAMAITAEMEDAIGRNLVFLYVFDRGGDSDYHERESIKLVRCIMVRPACYFSIYTSLV